MSSGEPVCSGLGSLLRLLLLLLPQPRLRCLQILLCKADSSFRDTSAGKSSQHSSTYLCTSTLNADSNAENEHAPSHACNREPRSLSASACTAANGMADRISTPATSTKPAGSQCRILSFGRQTLVLQMYAAAWQRGARIFDRVCIDHAPAVAPQRCCCLDLTALLTSVRPLKAACGGPDSVVVIRYDGGSLASV